MKTFETHDLYLAAALKLHSFKLIEIKKNDTRRGIFVFEDQPGRSGRVFNLDIWTETKAD